MRKFKLSGDENHDALKALESGNARFQFHPPREAEPGGRTERKLQNITNELYSDMGFKPTVDVDVRNGDPESPEVGEVWLDESEGEG